MFKIRGLRIKELYSQMGFYFQMKRSMGILETNDWKKEYVKKIKLKKTCAQEQQTRRIMLKKAAHSNPNMVRQQWISGAGEALEAALRGPCLGNGAFGPLGWRAGCLRAFWSTRFPRRWVRNGPARRSKGRRTTRKRRRAHSHFHRSTACLRSCFLWTNGNSRTASELGNEREQWNWAKERTVFFSLVEKWLNENCKYLMP